MTISTIGAAHVAAALAALAFGGVVLAMRKGTLFHRSLGIAYAASMIGVNLTALSLYRLTGHFGPFHAMALLSLGMIATGVTAAAFRWRGWLLVHYRAMSYSYVGLLAATTAEALVRVPALQVHGAARGISIGVAIAVVYAVIGRTIVRRLQPSVLSTFGAD
jgi:uncharacterized membrane protein